MSGRDLGVLYQIFDKRLGGAGIRSYGFGFELGALLQPVYKVVYNVKGYSFLFQKAGCFLVGFHPQKEVADRALGSIEVLKTFKSASLDMTGCRFLLSVQKLLFQRQTPSSTIP